MKFLKNNAGISLIWVIILIVVVGTLSATLLTASNFNIRFGVDEVDTSRAFYAAEAGVEYTKNSLAKIVLNNKLDKLQDDSNLNKYLDSNSTDFFTDEDGGVNYLDDGQNLHFRIKFIDNNDYLKFESTGYAFGNRQKIEFGLDIESIYDVAILLNDRDGLDVDDYTDWAGGDGEFSKDNIGLVDLGGWWDFLDPYKGEHLESEEKDNKRYVRHSGEVSGEGGAGVRDFIDFDQVPDDLVTGGFDFSDKGDKLFFKSDIVEIEGAVEWEYDEPYKKGEVVYDDEYYYVAIQDLPEYDNEDNDYIQLDDENYWSLIDDDEDLTDIGFHGNITIEDKIVIVNGSLSAGRRGGQEGSVGNVTFKNSLILVRNSAEIGGNTTLDNSLIFSFNEDGDGNNEFLFVTGANSINLPRLISSPIADDWLGVEEKLADMEGSISDIGMIQYWRQVQ